MAVSTAGQILARHRVGQEATSQVSARRDAIEHSPYEVAGAGDSMTADYKGQFRMGNGALCYPLTVADPFSRYVFAIEAMPSTYMAGGQGRLRTRLSRVWHSAADDQRQRHAVLQRKLARRTDAAVALVDRARDHADADRARPSRAERDSRADASNAQGVDPPEPADRTCALSSEASMPFGQEFNHIRPHQSLGQKPPATRLSDRIGLSRSRPRTLEYDTTMDVRAVQRERRDQVEGARRSS